MLPVAVALLLVVWGLYAPLEKALQIGGDDSIELNKALLVHRRPDLAARMWNDQPWLHTLLVAKVFSFCGERAAIPRIFSLICSFLMIVACWRIMGQDSCRASRLTLVFFLLTSPIVINLGSSAMLELPAFALALVAVALSSRMGSWKMSRIMAYVSGTIMVLAAFVKLTALLVVPAWGMWLWLQRKEYPLREFLPRCATGGVFGLLTAAAISPTFSLNSLLLSHWAASQAVREMGGYSAPWLELFVTDPAISLAAGLGLIHAVRTPTQVPKSLLFAGTWLLVAGGIHVFHRPWWEYYALHFQIPLSLLAAHGTLLVLLPALEAIVPWLHSPSSKPRNASAHLCDRAALARHAGVSAALAALLLATAFGVRLPAAIVEMQAILHTPTVKDNHYVSLLRTYSAKADWLFTDDTTLAFHAGLIMPPEMVVVVLKRSWIGEFDRSHCVRILQHYRPDLVFIRREEDWVWQTLDRAAYIRVFWDKSRELWVNRRLEVVPATLQGRERTADELVRELDL